jgi:hypothetical protein
MKKLAIAAAIVASFVIGGATLTDAQTGPFSAQIQRALQSLGITSDGSGGASFTSGGDFTDFLALSTVNTTAATGTDCDDAAETGRLHWDSTNDSFEVCSGASGWVGLAESGPSVGSETFKQGLGLSKALDVDHDIDVGVGSALSADGTHDIVADAGFGGKQLDVPWATGSSSGMLGTADEAATATLTFSLTASPDTITSDESTFATCNAETIESGTVVITGGSTNNGTYEVASCTDTVLTLGEGVLAGDETGTAGEYEVRYLVPASWYHVHIIESAGTADICIDKSLTAVTCLSESGYDQYKYLQSLRLVNTSNIQ